MKIVGVDPGLSGGVAFLSDDGTIEAFPLPLLEEEFVKGGKKKKRKIADLETLSEIFLDQKPTHGVLERVSARPGQGGTSMFRFGTNYGHYQMLLQMTTDSWIEVTPQVWKKPFFLNSDKDNSLELAREMWPDKAQECFRLKKHDGMAEAALIAQYGFDNFDLFS